MVAVTSLVGRVAVALAVAIAAFAVAGTTATAAPSRPGATVTFAGIERIARVLRSNGFPAYRATRVRCHSRASWLRAVEGDDSLLGFYDGGPWVDVPAFTCRVALGALDGTTVTPGTVFALATIVHETVHRQGIEDESTTECLASWLTAHAVLAATGSRRLAIRTFRWARWSSAELADEYASTDRECGLVALDHGVEPIADGHAA